MQMTLYTLPLLAAVLISAIVAVLAWQRRPSPGARAFSAAMCLVVLNILVSLFLLSSTTLDSFLFWVKMSFLGGGLGVAWLVFTLRYDGRSLRDVTRIAALAAVEPTAMFVLAWFNDLHHLLWSQAVATPITAPGALLRVDTRLGPLFWVWSAYQYALLLLGVVILLRGLFRVPSAYRGQTVAVLVAMIVPWTANVLFLVGRTSVTGIDLTPFAFALSGVALFLALYRFRFLDLSPIPRSLVLEASPNGTLVLDGRGRLVDINPAAEAILGCSAHDVLGAEGTQVLPALSSAASGTDAELTFVCDGVERSYDLHVAPLRKRMGKLALLVDVTDRKRMTAHLLQAQKMDALGLMAGGIAHDFNNMLTGIIGNINLARIEDDTDRSSELLQEAEQEILQARGLSQQLLTFAKGGAPVRSVQDLAPVLREAVSFALRGSDVSASFDLPADLWWAGIDKGQFSQVFSNIVINADEAMPAGGTISVVARNITLDDDAYPDLAPGDYVRIDLSDTGVGIAETDLRKIFDPFFSTKRRGSGLGLATSYAIVHKHDGYIGVVSTPGAGTTFSILLPAVPAGPSLRSPETAPRFSGHGRVLVMDDEPTVRQVAVAMLKKLGYEAEAVPDGASALRADAEACAVGRPFSVILMDLTIPGGMGGQEAAALFRKNRTSAQLIASSGYATDPVMAHYREYHFDGVLAKPYSFAELTSVLASLATQRSS